MHLFLLRTIFSFHLTLFLPIIVIILVNLFQFNHFTLIHDSKAFENKYS